jgi:hypothetical protein
MSHARHKGGRAGFHLCAESPPVPCNRVGNVAHPVTPRATRPAACRGAHHKTGASRPPPAARSAPFAVETVQNLGGLLVVSRGNRSGRAKGRRDDQGHGVLPALFSPQVLGGLMDDGHGVALMLFFRFVAQSAMARSELRTRVAAVRGRETVIVIRTDAVDVARNRGRGVVLPVFSPARLADAPPVSLTVPNRPRRPPRPDGPPDA